MIGKENIEEKIFQYFEGDLPASESLELENFIKNNPEYQIDFDAWKNSVVQDDHLKYEHADELLVHERFTPKGWFKWASGGVIFFGFVFASVVLMNKFDEGEERLYGLEVDKHNLVVKNENSFSDTNVLDVSEQKEFEKDTDSKISRDLGELNQNTSKNNNHAKTNHLAKSNTTVVIQENSLSSISPGDLTVSPDFQHNKTNVHLTHKSSDRSGDVSTISYVKDENQIKKLEKSNYISTEFLQVKKYMNLSAIPAIKKSKYTYENPNSPNLFVTNNKDPYLNYALAHTIEENGSFVGNFNNGQGIRAEMLYRTEWPSVTSENFTSQIFSLDTRVDALKGGVGILVNTDQIGHGRLNSAAFSVIYSPKFLVKNISVEPSFKYTYNQKSISWNQVEENDVKDPRNGVLYASIPFIPDDVIKTTVRHQDIGVGLLINTNKMYIGGQVDHLNKASYTNDDFDQEIVIPYKISAMVGTDLMKSKESHFKLSPSLNYIQYGVYNALWVNTQFVYHGFFFSGGFASNEELMTSVGYTNNKVRLVYGLGFSKPSEFSGLPMTGGYYESHQLSLRVNLQPK